MTNIVMLAAMRCGLTEADFFKAAFAHEGLQGWQDAYALWCEKDITPTRGIINWFDDLCRSINEGWMTLEKQPDWSPQDVQTLFR